MNFACGRTLDEIDFLNHDKFGPGLGILFSWIYRHSIKNHHRQHYPNQTPDN